MSFYRCRVLEERFKFTSYIFTSLFSAYFLDDFLAVFK